jgi:ligand-binding sensor domain-containing protein
VQESGELVAGTNKIIVMQSPPFDPWIEITGDLTQTGIGATTSPNYHTITKLNSNPYNSDELLVGTSDGLVWKGNIASGNFENITSNLPEHYVSSVLFSKKTNGKLYATMTGYYNNFNQALIFTSNDAGQTWIDISSNLPAIGINSLISYVVAENEVLFIGTDGGVYYSENEGATWQSVGQNFPISAVYDLAMDETNNKLIAGTYGRSMWSYDLNWYVGLSEEKTTTFNLFPNPVSDKICIDISSESVKIISSDGKICWSQGNYIQNQEIDLSKLPSGEYLILTENMAKRFVKK